MSTCALGRGLLGARGAAPQDVPSGGAWPLVGAENHLHDPSHRFARRGARGQGDELPGASFSFGAVYCGFQDSYCEVGLKRERRADVISSLSTHTRRAPVGPPGSQNFLVPLSQVPEVAFGSNIHFQEIKNCKKNVNNSKLFKNFTAT